VLAFLNGRFVPHADLVVGHADAGVVYGATVTDFCRTYGGRLFRHPDHLRRFRRDAIALGIDVPFADAELADAANALVAANRAVHEVAVVSLATPGVPGHGPTVAMHTVELQPERYASVTAGARLVTAGRLDGGLVSPTVKHRSRVNWYLAGRAVAPGEVAVLLDTRGNPDTAIGSVLAVVGGVVVRPPAGAVLDGMTMGVVAELCAEIGVAFAEREIGYAALPAGVAEIMLAGSGFGVAPVASLDRRAFPTPGPVTARLMAAFAELVGRAERDE
jgi:branched-subunit amino acid aminotransferase/4-amino-4-deoxychorismate lyase